MEKFMPVARPTTIPVVCEWIMEHKPKRVLDIGIGFGMWGFLLRNYGVIWGSDDLTKDIYANWRDEIIVDGVEIYEFLITDLQRLIYNNIYIGDALDIVPKLGTYDLVMMGDVIEHIEKDRAIEFIKSIKCNLIITTPNYFCEGVAAFGNEHDKHKCWMKDEDFPDYPQIIHTGNQKVVIYER